MNQGDNRRWAVIAGVVIVALFGLLAACAVGATGGYLLARAQGWGGVSQWEPAMPERLMPRELEEDFRPQVPGRPFAIPEGLGSMNGAFLQEVIPGSPAEEAGLRAGDIITAVDGQPVTPEQDLAELIGGFDPGDRVTVTYVRHSDPAMTENQVSVLLGQARNDPNSAYLGVRYMSFFMDMELEFQQP